MHRPPDLSQAEIPEFIFEKNKQKLNPEYPHDLMCASGHLCPSGTRFFSVSGTVLYPSQAGVYCEFCLEISNRMSQLRKEGKEMTFSPFLELLRLMREKSLDERNRKQAGRRTS
jgi:hypothetical protein